MDKFLFTGTGVALVTPFETNGQLDLPALTRLVEHVLSGGAEYLVPLGTTGESVTLSADEKLKVVETVLKAAAGKAKVLLGAGGNHTAEVVDWVKKAGSLGVDGILSVSPYYNKPTQAGILAHFRKVAESSGAPVILYNVPGRTSSNMLPATTLTLAREFPNIIGIKEASGNLEQFMAIIRESPPHFKLISGDDNLTLPALSIGAVGVISVLANVYPKGFSTMVRNCLAGHFDSGIKLHYRYFQFVNQLFSEGNPAGAKAALKILGICGETLRLPLVPVSDEHRRILKEEMTGIAE